MRLYFVLEDCDSSFNKAIYRVGSLPYEENCYYADVEDGSWDIDTDCLIPYNTNEFVDWGIIKDGKFISDPDDEPEDAIWGSLYFVYKEGKKQGFYFMKDDSNELEPVDIDDDICEF